MEPLSKAANRIIKKVIIKRRASLVAWHLMRLRSMCADINDKRVVPLSRAIEESITKEW